MAAEQVIVSLGYPRADLNPIVTGPRWSYLTESDAKFFLVWTADDRLQAVDGPSEVRARVLGN